MSAMVTCLSPTSSAKAKAGWGSRFCSAGEAEMGVLTASGEAAADVADEVLPEPATVCAQLAGQYATNKPTCPRNKARGVNLWDFMGCLRRAAYWIGSNDPAVQRLSVKIEFMHAMKFTAGTFNSR
jgi:hypothetical protein